MVLMLRRLLSKSFARDSMFFLVVLGLEIVQAEE